MPRLHRPYIPTDVRLRVAWRQLGWSPDEIEQGIQSTKGQWGFILGERKLDIAERLGCSVEELQLDHDPALENRQQFYHPDGTILYLPDANDPEHLIYRSKQAHHIKTHVRGDGAQYSDTVLAKRERRRSRPKKQSRPLQSANRWPPKGSRKINWRKP